MTDVHFIQIPAECNMDDIAEAASHLRRRQIVEPDAVARRLLSEDIDELLDMWSRAHTVVR